ncbi:MAG: DUF3575 domain-containing protein [Bacteroidales bacterium]|nr:DUF3575 domain-containing protein [Bacteroidales bacterium]
MKKIMLIALLFALSWQANAQISEIPDFKRNELKLDVIYILFSTVKVEYEHWLNDWSSVGVVGFYNFGSGFLNGGEPLWRSKVLGTYRLYFNKNPMQGFFLEGTAGIISGSTVDNWLGGTPKRYTAFGAGVAIGWKWFIPQSGVTLDLTYGLGRMFVDSSNEDVVPIYLRVGATVGKRF